MVLVDCVTRLIPGVLGSSESILEESHSNSLLEYPQYTRPAVYDGIAVPEVLLSGNHKEIEKWRKIQSLKKTLQSRPDLFLKKCTATTLTEEEKKLLKELENIIEL